LIEKPGKKLGNVILAGWRFLVVGLTEDVEEEL
jgi:hypothetical protein